MTFEIQGLDKNISKQHTHTYIESLLGIEQESVCLESQNLKRNEIEKNVSKEKKDNDVFIITIGQMEFAVFADNVDFIKVFDNRLKVYADQAEPILGQVLFSGETINVIRPSSLHANIIENQEKKEKKILVFNQACNGVLCDEVSYHENVSNKEIVLFDNNLITSWFIGVYKEKAARILDLKKLINLLKL